MEDEGIMAININLTEIATQLKRIADRLEIIDHNWEAGAYTK